MPHLLSVNVGPIRAVTWQDQLVTTGIWKSPVAGRRALRGVNIDGDDQADRRVHGGPDKAVYAYADEDYDWWRGEGVAAAPALFGENLTTRGLDLSAMVIGTQWTVGSAVLEVAQPRLPCLKLGVRMDDARFPRRFQLARRPGAYLRIVTEGDVGAGDPVVVGDAPAHGITICDMADALDDEGQRSRLATLPYLPRFWREVVDGR